MVYLVTFRGPDRGRQRVLEKDRTVLGRESDCDIVLTNPETLGRKHLAVSRRHAIISKIDGKYWIEDGDGNGRKSHNRTYVNGEMVAFPKRVQLRNDDVIKICDFSFIFRDEDSSSYIEASISHSNSSLFLAQPAERLKLLLEITNHLSHTLDQDVLLPYVAETLLQLFKQADHAFVILRDEASGDLMVHTCKSRRPEEEGQAGFSGSIVMQCLDTVEGLLSNDVGKQFPASESAYGLALRSVICAPLWDADEKASGALLVDTRNDRKKFTEDDLNLLMGVAGQASIALTNANFHQSALAQARLLRDLELAREVVRSFLPGKLPAIPGYEFFAHYQSAREVGGDYYDFIPVAVDRLSVLVGDVAGKGVPAALVMTRFSAEARACLGSDTELAPAVRQLNSRMQPISLTDRFVTLAALLLNLTAHTVTAVNAGHPSPLLVRATGALEEVSPRAVTGPPLAVADGYAYEERQVALLPGDSLVLYSDGVTDALNVEGRQLGLGGVRAALDRGPASPRELGDRILRAVNEHAAGCSQADDITLVCLGRTA
jgi:serine phosphatase RsbU (regulator of sigma subunit)/pSer/pThr/pTyr-binding forkhead associated (FHA) protein